MMTHIGWGGEQTTTYKGMETFPYLIAVSRMGVDTRWCASKDAGPQREVVPHRLEEG